MIVQFTSCFHIYPFSVLELITCHYSDTTLLKEVSLGGEILVLEFVVKLLFVAIALVLPSLTAEYVLCL